MGVVGFVAGEAGFIAWETVVIRNARNLGVTNVTSKTLAHTVYAGHEFWTVRTWALVLLILDLERNAHAANKTLGARAGAAAVAVARSKARTAAEMAIHADVVLVGSGAGRAGDRFGLRLISDAVAVDQGSGITTGTVVRVARN